MSRNYIVVLIILRFYCIRLNLKTLCSAFMHVLGYVFKELFALQNFRSTKKYRFLDVRIVFEHLLAVIGTWCIHV